MAATLNPSDVTGWQPAAVVFSNGNLTITLGSGDSRNPVTVRATVGVTGGKYYFQAVANYCGSQGDLMVGWSPAGGYTKLGDDAPAIGIRQSHDVVCGTYIGFGDPYTTGGEIDIATDFDNLLIWYRVTTGGVTGNWNNNATADPATGSGGFSFPSPGQELFPAIYMSTYNPTSDIDMMSVAFASGTWTRAAPAGFGEVVPAGSVGTAAGTSTATAVGVALAASTGAISGTSTAAAVGTAAIASTGRADGVATVAGTGAAIAAAIGSADGRAAVIGLAAVAAASIGRADGSSTAVARSNGEQEGSVGNADGVSTATAVGASISTATGKIQGSSSAKAVGSAILPIDRTGPPYPPPSRNNGIGATFPTAPTRLLPRASAQGGMPPGYNVDKTGPPYPR